MSESVTGLASNRWIAKQFEAVSVPRRVPIGRRRAVEDQTLQPKRRSDIHWPAVVANEKLSPGHQGDKSIQTGRLFTSHPRNKFGLLGYLLRDPNYGTDSSQAIGKLNVASHWPSLVVATGTRMNDDAVCRLTAEGGKVWRRGKRGHRTRLRAQRVQQSDCDAPVLEGDWIAQRNWHSTMEQKAKWTGSKQRAYARPGTAEPRNEVCGVCLVITEHASIWCKLPNVPDDFKKLQRMFPRTIERCGLKSQRIDVMAGDRIKGFGNGASEHRYLRLRHEAAQLLHHGKEDHIVAKLVHFEDDQMKRFRVTRGLHC